MSEVSSSINVNNITWKPGTSDKKVLDQISVDMEQAHFYGILGPNGAGKTSLVRSILNFISLSEGEIKLDDTVISTFGRKDIARRIAFLPQSINSEIDLSVYEMVAMGREPYIGLFSGLSAEDKKIINEALEFTGCTDLKDKKFNLLSGGERQRVMIARTIAQDSEWIVLDEPVSNLDIKYQVELMNEFSRLMKEKGKTVITIIHDINLAIKYCDRVILMKEGKVEYMGDTEQVITPENLLKIYDIPFEIRRESQCTYCFPLI